MNPYYEAEGVTIYHADAREVLPLLDPVDLVLTDPPYPNEFDYCWDVLAEAQVKPGGSLFTYCGHYQVPRVISALLSQGWTYRWLCIQTNDGAVPRMMGFRLFVTFKPVLWFVRPGAAPSWPFMSDTLPYEHRGRLEKKAMHTWGQPMSHLPILSRSLPGDVVLDPFMGSGTTLCAARNVGRKAIGIEIEERYCEIAVRRLGQGVLAV